MPYKHLCFSTNCTNVKLTSSLSGRGIVVQEKRHTSHRFLLQGRAWFPSSKASLTGRMKLCVMCLTAISLVTSKIIYACRTSENCCIIDFNISTLTWLIITLDLKLHCNLTPLSEVTAGTLKKSGQVGPWCCTQVARGTCDPSRNICVNGIIYFRMFIF